MIANIIILLSLFKKTCTCCPHLNLVNNDPQLLTMVHYIQDLAVTVFGTIVTSVWDKYLGKYASCKCKHVKSADSKQLIKSNKWIQIYGTVSKLWRQLGKGSGEEYNVGVWCQCQSVITISDLQRVLQELRCRYRANDKLPSNDHSCTYPQWSLAHKDSRTGPPIQNINK